VPIDPASMEGGHTMATTERGEMPVTLPDGTEIIARPIRPDDLAALQRFHTRLSQQSIYLRFFGVMPELSEERARYFTHLDGVDRFAWIGIDPRQPDEIIGVVRMDREPGTDGGEYAAIIEDRWQGRGVGFALTRLVIDAARRRGYRILFAIVMPENLRMLNLLRDLGLPTHTRWVDGAQRVEVDLTTEPRITAG